MFKDINPGLADSKPSDFNIFQGKLFFGATDGVNGYELWWSDGTPGGTLMFKDLVPGNTLGLGYSGLESIQFNNKLMFLATTTANGSEPWISDGTPQGTFMLKDIYAGTTGSGASLFYAANDSVVYFRASSPAMECAAATSMAPMPVRRRPARCAPQPSLSPMSAAKVRT